MTLDVIYSFLNIIIEFDLTINYKLKLVTNYLWSALVYTKSGGILGARPNMLTSRWPLLVLDLDSIKRRLHQACCSASKDQRGQQYITVIVCRLVVPWQSHINISRDRRCRSLPVDVHGSQLHLRSTYYSLLQSFLQPVVPFQIEIK